ncbi:MAG: crossover junction endodeoxyribonuclease RuvC [Oscillospiraceae bacterium]|nr:crossover junction endodeoxyribonuclease RuvC [Oscillospiraceae bacterium]
MIILGIDPGYAIVGYGVADYDKNRFTVLAHGAVTTDADMSFPERLSVIYNRISEIIDTYNIDVMAVERLYFTTNQKTAIDVSQARGVILLAGQENGVAVYEYTPLQVKQATVGYGKATKKQVMEMTARILNLQTTIKLDDTADALAVAICHGFSSRSIINVK